MKKIYKYVVPLEGEIELPKGSRILSFQIQREDPCIWVLVDPLEEALEARQFRIVGTGHPMGEDLESGVYLGTVQMANGALVWHLFERREENKDESSNGDNQLR